MIPIPETPEDHPDLNTIVDKDGRWAVDEASITFRSIAERFMIGTDNGKYKQPDIDMILVTYDHLGIRVRSGFGIGPMRMLHALDYNHFHDEDAAVAMMRELDGSAAFHRWLAR